MKKLPNIHTAHFSADRRHRYWLKADLDWDIYKKIMFLMLNPSTADEVQSDPTVTRCKNYAKLWGYNRVYVCNIFAYRSTDPQGLREVEDPIGQLNDNYICNIAGLVDTVVCAWGTHGEYLNRGEEVVELLTDAGYNDKLHALGINKGGTPKHPLYLRKNQEIFRYGRTNLGLS